MAARNDGRNTPGHRARARRATPRAPRANRLRGLRTARAGHGTTFPAHARPRNAIPTAPQRWTKRNN
eukprot:6277404-Lingulodinium_polyedra.AAC.1